jgi:hypothetical protein
MSVTFNLSYLPVSILIGDTPHLNLHNATLEIRIWIFIVIQTIFCVNHILLECNNFENFKNEWCINVNALADGKKLRTLNCLKTSLVLRNMLNCLC